MLAVLCWSEKYNILIPKLAVYPGVTCPVAVAAAILAYAPGTGAYAAAAP